MSRLSANFVFCLFYVSNILLFGCGIGIAVLGIYIWTETKRAGEFEITFLILGIIEVLIAILGCYSRTSLSKLSCYSCLLSIIFMVQLVASILGLIYKSKIIDLAAEHSSDASGADQFKNMIRDNVDIAFYCTLVVDGVQFVCLILTHIYKNQLKGLSETDRYRLMSDHKPKIDLTDVVENPQKKEEKAIKEKYDQKRKDLQEKYPEYYEKKIEKDQTDQNKKKKFFK